MIHADALFTYIFIVRYKSTILTLAHAVIFFDTTYCVYVATACS